MPIKQSVVNNYLPDRTSECIRAKTYKIKKMSKVEIET